MIIEKGDWCKCFLSCGECGEYWLRLQKINQQIWEADVTLQITDEHISVLEAMINAYRMEQQAEQIKRETGREPGEDVNLPYDAASAAESVGK
jgi:hypothetical protein